MEEEDEPVTQTFASGILRLRPPDFLRRQLATFRAEGSRPTGRAAAVGRFDALHPLRGPSGLDEYGFSLPGSSGPSL